MSSSVWYLLPGLSLLVSALLVLVLDLVLDRARSARWACWVALAGTAGALAATLALGETESVPVLNVAVFDGFTRYVWALVLVALAMVLLLSESYIRQQSGEPAVFYSGVLFFGFGALLLAASANTIMLLLTVDLLSLVGYMLTGYFHTDKRSTEAAIKYLVYGSAVSAVMALGLSWLYGLTGTTDYGLTARALSGAWVWSPVQAVSPRSLIPVLIFILAGFAFKIGSAPFHQWLPDAFEGAPVPVTAALAIVPKVAGFAALVRVTMVMLPDYIALGAIWRSPLLAFLAVGAMLFGNLTGLWQTNIKRLMAYSGISQVGYALIGVTVATQQSLSAVLVYLAVYTLAELGTFAVIAVVSHQTGLEMILDYDGLHQRAPILAVVLLVCVLSLFGMPGTAGFMGKLRLFTAVFEAGQVWLLVVAAVNSVISLAYYWKVMRAAFILPGHGLPPIGIPVASLIVLVFAVLSVLVLGIYPNLVLDWADAAVRVFAF